MKPPKPRRSILTTKKMWWPPVRPRKAMTNATPIRIRARANPRCALCSPLPSAPGANLQQEAKKTWLYSCTTRSFFMYVLFNGISLKEYIVTRTTHLNYLGVMTIIFIFRGQFISCASKVKRPVGFYDQLVHIVDLVEYALIRF